MVAPDDGVNASRGRPVRYAAIGCSVVGGAALLLAGRWAGERSGEVGGMEASGFGAAALLLVAAGIVTVVLGGVAALVHASPAPAAILSGLAGAAGGLGGSAGLGMLSPTLGTVAGLAGAVVVLLACAGRLLAGRSPG